MSQFCDGGGGSPNLLGERWRAAGAEGRDRRALFLLHDHLVLARRIARLETLPRQTPLEKVHEYLVW